MVALERPVSSAFEHAYAASPGPQSWRQQVSRSLARLRYQFAGGLITATLVPALVRWPDTIFGQSPSLNNAMVGCLLAFVLGFILFRKLTVFPGVRAIGYVLPVFASTYGLMAVLFLTLRLEYSRYQLLASFVLVCAWFIIALILARRSQRVQLAVVPGGRVHDVMELPQADWVVLDEPRARRSWHMPIVADLSADLSPKWERFITQAALAGRPIYHFKQVSESLSGRVQVDHLSENTFGSLTPNSIYASAKRYVDVALAAVALVLTAPLLAVIGIAVRMTSSGPAVFKQERIGLGGKRFVILKFRTMRALTDAERLDPGRHDEARVTAVGRFLRKSRLDELPQLFNILKGEMSWIGPRPEMVPLAEMYDSAMPFYQYRYVVRPGLTGWAQVNQGHVVGVSDAKIKLQYDFFYVKHFSLWLDLLVLLRTIRIVLTGYGAR